MGKLARADRCCERGLRMIGNYRADRVPTPTPSASFQSITGYFAWIGQHGMDRTTAYSQSKSHSETVISSSERSRLGFHIYMSNLRTDCVLAHLLIRFIPYTAAPILPNSA